MQKIKLVLAYDGTRYNGWQVQPNGTAIQQVVESRLSQILSERIAVVGSGRTDAGVHARGQVAHFSTEQTIDPYRLSHSLNCLLPTDIRVVQLTTVPVAFHARYSAIEKTYTYYFCLQAVQYPFERLYSLHVTQKLNFDKMRQEANDLLGTHDFSAFANSPTEGSVAKDPVRTIHAVEWIENGDGIALKLVGNGFLYKMVRNIVGTLLEIGRGKEYAIGTILQSKDRTQAGPAAPPHGLFLEAVTYPEEL